MTDIDPEIPIVVEPFMGPDEYKVRVPDAHREDLQQALDEAGLTTSLGAEFSAGADFVLHVSRIAGEVGALPVAYLVARGVEIFVKRHAGKKVTVGGTSIEGYSADDVEKLLPRAKGTDAGDTPQSE
ncbi:hypothetical protein [Promicromonospora soli]